MNLGDPELEFIDPTPNVHSLFLQFDEMFFWARLASRAVVRWSKRMYSCAGVCSYEGRGGLCDIALSEPLLKLRPRKDLVQTLLHEMIHAYLFVTCRDQDRDGHGPNFKAHMHRINQSAGLHITIYHDFHDEVRLYKNHVWRCNGPCQNTRPHFGIVRKTANRPPCERDFWWGDHRRRCGGTFIKIQEPNPPAKKNSKTTKKPNADITQFITTKTNNPQVPKPVLKDSNSIPIKTKNNSSGTLVVTKKGPVFNPKVSKSPVIFSGKGETLSDNKPRSNSVGVVGTVRSIWAAKKLPSISSSSPNQSSALETVRNVWANKQIPVTPTAACSQYPKQNNVLNNTIFGINKQSTNKHKIDSHADSPPSKMKKIDDYFKATASTILKDVYGEEIKIINNKDNKLVAVNEFSPKVNKTQSPLIEELSIASTSQHVVDCPICRSKINNQDINRHLDECLNKEVIENLTKEALPPQPTSLNADRKSLKNLYGNVPQIPAYIPKTEEIDNMINERISTPEPVKVPDVPDNLNIALNDFVLQNESQNKPAFNNPNSFNPVDIKRAKALVKKINYDKNLGRSDKYVVLKDEDNNVDFGYLPSFLDDVACKIENPIVKTEPGVRNDVAEIVGQKCACCGIKIDKPLEDHLDECVAFFENNNTMPNEGASTSFANETIVIDDDDDDIFDESQTLNATGTKTPCPCCLQMIEELAMNDHLDRCLSGDFQEDL